MRLEIHCAIHKQQTQRPVPPNNKRLPALLIPCLIFFTAFWAPSQANGEPVRVKDQRGKFLQLKAHAKRIVTIPIPMAAVIMALDGSSDRLIAIHPASLRSIRDGFLKRVFPKALSL